MQSFRAQRLRCTDRSIRRADLFRRKQAETGGNNNRFVIQCVAENRPVEPTLKGRSRQRQAKTGEKNQPKGGVKAETGRNRQKGRAENNRRRANTRANQRQLRRQGGNRRKPAETDICLLLNALGERISTRSRVKAETGRNRRKHRADTPLNAQQAGWRCARVLAAIAARKKHRERETAIPRVSRQNIKRTSRNGRAHIAPCDRLRHTGDLAVSRRFPARAVKDDAHCCRHDSKGHNAAERTWLGDRERECWLVEYYASNGSR
jgi:hypothetical protein